VVVVVGLTVTLLPERVPGVQLKSVRVPIPGTTVNCVELPVQIVGGVAEIDSVALLLSETVPLNVVLHPAASEITQL
jgi:hypothetical protein